MYRISIHSMWQITTKHFMFCIISNPNIFLRLKITNRNENHANWPVMVQETSYCITNLILFESDGPEKDCCEL